jgi:hypothetical protein
MRKQSVKTSDSPNNFSEDFAMTKSRPIVLGGLVVIMNQ